MLINIERFILFLLILTCCAGTVQAAPTSEVHLVKFSEDSETKLCDTYVNYQWMEENLPVYGDGVTHYYHQGPVFVDDPEGRWDVNETTNFKDHGAVIGTNIRDLCDMVGGLEPGDEVMVHAEDGYHVQFTYENVYNPDPRQGPIVLTWYNGEDAEKGERQGVGYTPDFYAGMRMVFFADNSTNAEGLNVFGNNDMRNTMPETSVHFYEIYPSTNGYTVKWVDEIRVYSGGYEGTTDAPVKSLIAEENYANSSPVTVVTVVISLACVIGCIHFFGRRRK
jgi:hypothetical protein